MSEEHCEVHDQPQSWCAAGYASAGADPAAACPVMAEVRPEFRYGEASLDAEAREHG